MGWSGASEISSLHTRHFTVAIGPPLFHCTFLDRHCTVAISRFPLDPATGSRPVSHGQITGFPRQDWLVPLVMVSKKPCAPYLCRDRHSADGLAKDKTVGLLEFG